MAEPAPVSGRCGRHPTELHAPDQELGIRSSIAFRLIFAEVIGKVVSLAIAVLRKMI